MLEWLVSAESGSRPGQPGSGGWLEASVFYLMPFRVDSLLYYIHFHLLATGRQFSIGFGCVVAAINALEALSAHPTTSCPYKHMNLKGSVVQTGVKYQSLR